MESVKVPIGIRIKKLWGWLNRQSSSLPYSRFRIQVPIPAPKFLLGESISERVREWMPDTGG